MSLPGDMEYMNETSKGSTRDADLYEEFADCLATGLNKVGMNSSRRTICKMWGVWTWMA